MNESTCFNFPFEMFHKLNAGLWKPETLLLLYLATSQFKQ